MVKKNDDELRLTIGSTYNIKSIYARDTPLETEGKFIAYTMVGQDLGFVIEMKDGKKRVIPSHMIMSLDIIRTAEKDEEDVEEKAGYYG